MAYMTSREAVTRLLERCGPSRGPRVLHAGHAPSRLSRSADPDAIKRALAAAYVQHRIQDHADASTARVVEARPTAAGSVEQFRRRAR